MTKYGKLMDEKRKWLDEKRQEKHRKDKDIIPAAVSCRYFTLYPEANYGLYHVLGAWEAAGCTLPSLNTDLRSGQCRYFFQGGMNLSIELRLGMPHTLVESRDTPKSQCSYVSKLLQLYAVLYLDIRNVHFIKKIGIHQNYCTMMMLKALAFLL